MIDDVPTRESESFDLYRFKVVVKAPITYSDEKAKASAEHLDAIFKGIEKTIEAELRWMRNPDLFIERED